MSNPLEQDHCATGHIEPLAVHDCHLGKPARVVSGNSFVHHERCEVGSQGRGVKAVGTIEWQAGVLFPGSPPGFAGRKTKAVHRARGIQAGL